MIVKSLTISGTSSALPLASDTSKAKWIQLSAPAANSNNILIGGAEVTGSVGFPIVPGAAMFLPSISDLFELYQFAKIFRYVHTGDVLNVLYGLEGSNS